jgi:hypothetical protein
MREHAVVAPKSKPKSKERRELKTKRNEWRITKMVLAIFLSFLICYLPITIVKVADDEVRFPGTQCSYQMCDVCARVCVCARARMCVSLVCGRPAVTSHTRFKPQSPSHCCYLCTKLHGATSQKMVIIHYLLLIQRRLSYSTRVGVLRAKVQVLVQPETNSKEGNVPGKFQMLSQRFSKESENTLGKIW